MESLSEISWDVVIAGTGLSQSLLALALSRCGKKVLHVDKNNYYGGAEAALSLQEIEEWAENVNDASRPSSFRNAVLQVPEHDPDSHLGLGFSRAYSISLSPQLIYTRSNLLPALVSSKVHAQLEFLAVGSWWIYSKGNGRSEWEDTPTNDTPLGALRRIPGGREDVFSDKSIDLRSSRSLMKFLKLAADVESHSAMLNTWGSKPFPEFLTSEFKIPEALQDPLLALTSSPHAPRLTLTSFALPRIYQHLTSIGLFGPGFGAVVPKWGGLSEIAQVGCRAGAVGGGVYVLDKGIESIEINDLSAEYDKPEGTGSRNPALEIRLEGDEDIRAHLVVGSRDDLPKSESVPAEEDTISISHSITITSSALPSLFYLAGEGAPPPAATVVVFPTGSLSSDVLPTLKEVPPVYLMVHSSDTGECPAGQSIIYGHTSLPQPYASTLLTLATQTLLKSLPLSSDPAPSTVWTLQYARIHHISKSSYSDLCQANEKAAFLYSNAPASDPSVSHTADSSIITLPSLPPGLGLDDSVLKMVREAWVKIVGGDDGSFMLFEERTGIGEADDEEF